MVLSQEAVSDRSKQVNGLASDDAIKPAVEFAASGVEAKALLDRPFGERLASQHSHPERMI
jgi:hypothetical protein